MQRLALVVSASAALAAGNLGCSSSGDGQSAKATHITTVRGQLGALAGKNVRVAGVVKGTKYPARLTQAGKADGASAGVQFSISNLPAGAKSIVVEIDGQTFAVQFPKSHSHTDAFAEMIPETTLASATVDLGDLQFNGTMLTCESNPFDTLLDTDEDGISDFDDDDIDGDGTENWDDESAFGADDDYADWGWTEGVDDELDGDGDGEASWDEEGWSWGDTEDWTVCADDDLACWQAQACAEAGATDPICTATVPDCEKTPNDPACQADPCEANPTLPECEADPCMANPSLPECQVDPCEANPSLPECQVDPCEANPEDPACDPCAANPEDPACQ